MSTQRNPDAWLKRVNALLAKAERTEFPAEAEALLAKAQELMTRHSIDEAMLARQRSGPPDEVITATVLVERPYASARCALLAAAARSNSCAVVVLGGSGLGQPCALVGHRSDIDKVRALFAALSLQATRAMVREAPDQGTRRFRHAFVLAYAGRIGERLEQVNRAARAEAQVATGASVALALQDRTRAVDRAVIERFSGLRRRRMSASDARGYARGREEADRADLGLARLRSHRGLPRG